MGTHDGSPTAAEIVTLLFTDLVGSTELLSRIGDDAAEEARRAHFGLLRDAIATVGGHEVKNLGDGLMVVFGSALDALRCAVSIQRSARDHNRRGIGPPFHIRVGLHAGEPVREGADYFGTPVVVARRLCDAAQGGQILASMVLVGLIGTRGGFSFRPVGPLDLKGLAEPVPAAEVDWEQPPAGPSPGRPGAPGLRPVPPDAGRRARPRPLPRAPGARSRNPPPRTACRGLPGPHGCAGRADGAVRSAARGPPPDPRAAARRLRRP